MGKSMETENLPVRETMAERDTLPVRETPPVRVGPQTDAGMAALSQMSNSEFEARLAGLKRGRERIRRIHEELLTRDVDYGVIPGTPKPTLLKPGAEKLINFYGFAADFTHDITYGKEASEPPITVLTRCILHLGDLSGAIVAVGCGAATSWERRYRWRRGERTCPRCGKEGSLLRSKTEGGYFCWSKKGGCGAKFPEDDERITSQVTGDVENTDAFDLLNTLVKMAAKRALVDGALRATATSAVYTQDLDEMHDTSALAPNAPGSGPGSGPGGGASKSLPNAPQKSPEARRAPSGASAPRPTNYAARAALEAAERPLLSSEPPPAPDADGAGSLDAGPPEEMPEEGPPVVCSVEGCGIVLSEDELLGSLKRDREFDGHLLCLIHGKGALAAYKAHLLAEGLAAQVQEAGSEAP